MGVAWLGAVMSSLMHIDNKKKDILIHSKGLKNVSNDTIFNAEKEDSLNFTQQQKKFCLILLYNGINSYISVNCVNFCKYK